MHWFSARRTVPITRRWLLGAPFVRARARHELVSLGRRLYKTRHVRIMHQHVNVGLCEILP